MSAYLEIYSAHTKICENAKIAAVIVLFRWPFLANSMTYILSGWEKSSIKGKQLVFYDIMKYLNIPYIIVHIFTKVIRVDLVGEGDIDLFPPRK